jgi:hypothetical protein
LKAVVDFAYTGSVVLAGSTVVAIIQAANLLQVEAVERAAVDFLVERLDAGNVLSAMALGTHLAVGALGRELRDKSRAWLNKNFGLVAAEPSFLELPAAEVAELVESDELEAKEEEAFEAITNWVKEDEAGRKAELDRLLPLVRFPLMADAPAAIMEEPLVSQHPLALQLMYEATPGFAKSRKAAGCPRLRHRVSIALAQAARNPELLALLGLPAGTPVGAVRAALNEPDEDEDWAGDLPIHIALYDEATGPELVRAMLDAGGDAMLGVPNTYSGHLPLHVAAWKSTRLAVVSLILARGPAGALRAKTQKGRTPLVVAEGFNGGPAAAEIVALLRAAMR